MSLSMDFVLHECVQTQQTTAKSFLQHLVYEKQVHANDIPAGFIAQLMATCGTCLLRKRVDVKGSSQ